MGSNRWLIAALGLAVACGGLGLAGCSETAEDTSGGTAMESAEGDRQVFAVEGMSCEGCVGTVKTALGELEGVESVDVSLEEKQAVVVGSPGKVSQQAVVAAIEAAGYKAQPAGEGEGEAE
jgi:copper ion binding protein